MHNPTMLLELIQAERSREMAAQRLALLALASRPRRARLGGIRRRLGGMLVRAGLRLLPREAAATAGGPRLATARGAATPRG